MALANYDVNQWSVSRDGLVVINYRSNVRNESEDIRRKQRNITQAPGTPLTEDEGQIYEVFNSDDKYNINEQLTANEVYDLLTVANLRELLQTFRVLHNARSRKAVLVQQLSNYIQQNPNRVNYVRQVYSEQVANQRRGQLQERNVNSSLLVSNQHRYSKSDFEGMKFKDILRSLFDMDYHTVFLYEKVLKREKLPINRATSVLGLINQVTNRVNGLQNPSPQQIEEIADTVFDKASRRYDKILKENTHLILDILFAPKRPFYIDKKLYTVLGYHQENGPTQDPEEGINMPARPATYVIYPVEIAIELTEQPPDKIKEKDIQSVACHLRREKIRKDWYDLWNGEPTQTGQYVRGVLGLEPAPEVPDKVFERKYHKTLKRRNVNLVGGSKKKKRKTRRNRRKGGDVSPPAAIIEYLEYFPMHSKNEVDAFYEKIDHDWRQGANILQIFSKSAKHINTIQQLLDAVHEAKTTTFCNRKPGDGDCEDTSDRVMELLPEIPGGKYTVESLRFEYSEQEDLDDYDVTPEFVQNHGILIFYSTETKPWFKITESITYR